MSDSWKQRLRVSLLRAKRQRLRRTMAFRRCRDAGKPWKPERAWTGWTRIQEATGKTGMTRTMSLNAMNMEVLNGDGIGIPGGMELLMRRPEFRKLLRRRRLRL